MNVILFRCAEYTLEARYVPDGHSSSSPWTIRFWRPYGDVLLMFICGFKIYISMGVVKKWYWYNVAALSKNLKYVQLLLRDVLINYYLRPALRCNYGAVNIRHWNAQLTVIMQYADGTWEWTAPLQIFQSSRRSEFFAIQCYRARVFASTGSTVELQFVSSALFVVSTALTFRFTYGDSIYYSF